MNMSYRQAWDLVDQLNRAFSEPVVTSQTGGRSGGGASLTPFGRSLCDRYRTIANHAAEFARSEFAPIAAKLKPQLESKTG
jgi:molybdate transport system regulatory protein